MQQTDGPGQGQEPFTRTTMGRTPGDPQTPEGGDGEGGEPRPPAPDKKMGK